MGRVLKLKVPFKNVMILKISDSAPHLSTVCDTRLLICLHHILSSVLETNQPKPGMLMGILVENVLSLAMQTAQSFL